MAIPLNLVDFDTPGEIFKDLPGEKDKKITAQWKALLAKGYKLHSFNISDRTLYCIFIHE